ncbi:hypothetical protein MNV49_004687 [Pseudohyphozyma bogoriensis]|nr:hypothetical protein MNV49_004687 [Pseudohyphozyma bogoriensis]
MSLRSILLSSFALLSLIGRAVGDSSVPSSVPVKATQIFAWETNHDTNKNIPACGSVTLSWSALDDPSSITPQGPFKIWVIQAGAPLQEFDGGSDYPGNYTFTMGLSQGKTISFGMVDSNGYSGGIAGPYTTTSSSNSCTDFSSTADLNVTAETVTASQACGAFRVDIAGGTGPYTYQMVELDTDHAFISSATVSSSSFMLDPTALVTAGQNFSIWASDANSKMSQVVQIEDTVGTSNCHTVTSTTSASTSASSSSSTSSAVATGASKKSSTPVGAIAGGIVGGIAVLAALAAGLFIYRRRSNQGHYRDVPGSADGNHGAYALPSYGADASQKAYEAPPYHPVALAPGYGGAPGAGGGVPAASPGLSSLASTEKSMTAAAPVSSGGMAMPTPQAHEYQAMPVGNEQVGGEVPMHSDMVMPGRSDQFVQAPGAHATGDDMVMRRE